MASQKCPKCSGRIAREREIAEGTSHIFWKCQNCGLVAFPTGAKCPHKDCGEALFFWEGGLHCPSCKRPPLFSVEKLHDIMKKFRGE